MKTVTIPWDQGSMTFNRDQLLTAILLTHDTPQGSIVAELREQHPGLGYAEAISLAAAAKVCIRKGIEP